MCVNTRHICLWDKRKNNLYILLFEQLLPLNFFFSQSPQTHGMVIVISEMPVENERIDSIRGKMGFCGWIPTHLLWGTIVILTWGGLIRIYEVSGCEQDWLDYKLETLFSVKFTKMISDKLNIFEMFIKKLYFITYLKENDQSKLLYKLPMTKYVCMQNSVIVLFVM